MSNGGGPLGGMRIGPMQTPLVVKQLMIGLTVAFFAQVILVRAGVTEVMDWGALSGMRFWKGMIWQPVTAVLLHDDRNLWHLLGNLFLLWMFGSQIAEQLGRRNFLIAFFGGGALAGLIKMLLVGGLHLGGINLPFLAWEVASVGASGAVFVVVAWWCMSWPDREISVLFVPLVFTGRQALPLWFLLEFGFSDGTVDHAIHVAGALVGALGQRWWRNHPPSPRQPPPRSRSSHLRLVPDDDGPIFH